jgi:uncharacterized membrane protein YgdD (TMEM256/DUF423 family)
MKLNKYILLAIWVGMFILCAVLGYLPPQEGANKWLLVIIAVLFFLPPALTVYQCQKEKDGKLLRLVRTVSLVVLIATVALLVVNLLSIALLLVMPEKTALIVGDVLYYALILVSTPMICGQYWGIGLVGWAALLWSSIFAEKSLKGK